MRPCATALRTTTACSSPAGLRSSTYWPLPRRKRRSSMRSIGLPTKEFAGRVWSEVMDVRDHLMASVDAGARNPHDLFPLRAFGASERRKRVGRHRGRLGADGL